MDLHLINLYKSVNFNHSFNILPDLFSNDPSKFKFSSSYRMFALIPLKLFKSNWIIYIINKYGGLLTSSIEILLYIHIEMNLSRLFNYYEYSKYGV